jgi:hypothetical protein
MNRIGGKIVTFVMKGKKIADFVFSAATTQFAMM